MAEFAYITLLTKSSYLAGVVILAYSLQRNQSSYPLIVCYTPSLSSDCVEALELEARHGTNIILRLIEPLQPPALSDRDLIAERFRDTWTKLRVFEPWKGLNEKKFTRLCYLDADMMLLKNLDYIFNTPLPGNDWIAANHACVCNLDSDPWAPATWNVENCAYTPLDEASGLTSSTPVPKSDSPITKELTKGRKETYTLLNSGLFLFTPSDEQWKLIYQKFESITPEKLKDYRFPDQDFIIQFFTDRWMSLPWTVNALKTMRYTHLNIWRDEAVVNLHYIVDKPWAGPRPVKVMISHSDSGSAGSTPRTDSSSGSPAVEWSKTGFKGLDGETHSWWWRTWDTWKQAREQQGHAEAVHLVEHHVYGGSKSQSKDMHSIGAQVQAFASQGK